MAKNYLFSFIKNDLVSSSEFKNFKLKKSVNHDDQEILVYELNLGLETIVAVVDGVQLTLVEHHITFFEKTKKDHPSQYHYTAALKDQRGRKYTLHVYFNHNDKITDLTNLSEDGKEALGSLAPVLGEHAIDQTRQIIGELRNLHQNKVKQLQEEYLSSESQLTTLSVNMEKNLQDYLVVLDNTINCLAKLCVYGNFSAHLKLFNNIRRSLSSTEIKPMKVEVDSDEESPELLREENVKMAQEKPPAVLLDEVEPHFVSYQKETEASKKVEVFSLLHAKVQQLLFLSKGQQTQLTKGDLSRIRKLVSFVDTEGKELLGKLLLNNLFDLALKLKNLARKLPASFLKTALATDQFKLLDFLLCHGDFAINTVTVEDVPLVLYCFLNHSDKTPKVDSLSVLIKHGASLLIKHQGLPVAFYIMESDTELKKAITAHPMETVSKTSFYDCLIQSLDCYLLMQPNGAQAELVKQSLAKYRTKRSLMLDNGYKNQFFGPKLTEKAEISAANARAKIDRNTLAAFHNDPEVKALAARLTEVVKLYLDSLTLSQKKSFINSGSEIINQLNTLTDNEEHVDEKAMIAFWKASVGTTIRTYGIEIDIHNISSTLKNKGINKKTKTKLAAALKVNQDNLKKLCREHSVLFNLAGVSGGMYDGSLLAQKIEEDIKIIKQSLEYMSTIPELRAAVARNKINDHVNNWPSIKTRMTFRLLTQEEREEVETYYKNIHQFALTYGALASYAEAELGEKDSSLDEAQRNPGP